MAGDGEAEFLRRRDEEHDSDKELEEEEERAEESEEGEEEEEEITEYEKQRLKTIERNKAMLASLQLPNLASSLTNKAAKAKETITSKSKGGGPRRRSERLKSVSGKRSAVDDESSSSDKSDSELSESQISPNKRKRRDQEYEPTDSSSESEDEMDEHEKEVLQEDTLRNDADMDEEEYALQQALALSLRAAADSPGTSKKKKKKRSSAKKRAAEESTELDPDDEELQDQLKSKPSKGKAKRKTPKLGNKRHFTEGEVDALFPFFDERGRGRLTLNDLDRVSTAHDFTWSQQELLDMIHLFNRSHTGVLDLVDFRNVAHRCNLIVSER